MQHHYVLFNCHTDGLSMYNALKKVGIPARISPTPRELSVCCGISLLVREEDIERIESMAVDQELDYISIEGLDNTFDKNRHKYG